MIEEEAKLAKSKKTFKLTKVKYKLHSIIIDIQLQRLRLIINRYVHFCNMDS